jgi:glucokinase
MITLAADVGGTSIKLGLVDDGSIIARTSIDSRSRDGLKQQLPRIDGAFRRMLGEAGVGLGQCDALSMGFPSIIDPESGRILDAYGKYEDAPGIDLSAWVREAFGLRFFIENDARVALLGEWSKGAGRGSNNLAMVTLGTGLGTAALIEGRLLRGVHGQAGILGGHLTVRFGGRLCSCGNRGCAEAEASTSVLEAVVREQPEYARSRLRELAPVDFAGLFRLAREHDDCAVKVRARTIEVWAAMIVNLIHAYDPERIVIGGGVLEGANDFWADLVATIHNLAHTPWGKIEIRPAILGGDAALIGCDRLTQEGVLFQ